MDLDKNSNHADIFKIFSLPQSWISKEKPHQIIRRLSQRNNCQSHGHKKSYATTYFITSSVRKITRPRSARKIANFRLNFHFDPGLSLKFNIYL